MESVRSPKRAWLAIVAVVAAVALLGAPVVQAATQKVKVKGTVNVKIKDSNGQTIESKNVPDLGLLAAPGTTGAIAVRNYAGGGGLLGTGDCTASEDVPSGDRANETTVAASSTRIITGIIVTGEDAAVSVSAPDLDALIGPGPVVTFMTEPGNQNLFVGLGNGLTVFPSELVFHCTGANGGNGSGNYVVLGQ